MIVLKYLFLSFTLLLLGCGDDVTIVSPHRSPALLYLQRTSEFTQVATLLFAQARDMWGQGIRALYYSGLTLARMKDLDGLLPAASGFHEKVWAQTTKKARRFFRDTMRGLRNRYDYTILVPPDEPVEDDLARISQEGPIAFAALFNDVAESLERQLSNCTMVPSTCPYCLIEPKHGCTRDAARSELAMIKEQVTTLVETTIPRLAKQPLDELS